MAELAKIASINETLRTEPATFRATAAFHVFGIPKRTKS